MQGENGGGGAREGRQRLALRWRNVLAVQRGIGERFAQGHARAALLGAGQGGEVDLEQLGSLDQEASRDLALVVLDQVEVARTDAEALGQRRLGEQTLLTQAADAPADHREGHAGPVSLVGAGLR